MSRSSSRRIPPSTFLRCIQTANPQRLDGTVSRQWLLITFLLWNSDGELKKFSIVPTRSPVTSTSMGWIGIFNSRRDRGTYIVHPCRQTNSRFKVHVLFLFLFLFLNGSWCWSKKVLGATGCFLRPLFLFWSYSTIHYSIPNHESHYCSRLRS